MSNYLDISALAEEALSAIKTGEEQTKTASDNEEENYKTEIGTALKEAAEILRNTDDSDVTNDDIRAFLRGVKEANALPIPNASAPGGVQQNVVGTEAPNPAAPSTGGLPTGAPKIGSSLGDELRDLAKHVKEAGAEQEKNKTIKAAKMVDAAVGLKHLTEVSK